MTSPQRQAPPARSAGEVRMNLAQLACYPNVPGARGTETSREAARAVQPRARPLREDILACLAEEPLTTPELAERLAPTPYCTVQPRVAELKAARKIEACPERGRSAAGWPVNRWRLVTGPPSPDPAALPDTPGPVRQLQTPPWWSRRMQERLCAGIVRALASEPKTSEAVAQELRLKPKYVANLVSCLRQGGVLQPSGFHGLTRYGKRAVRWEIRDEPYAPEVPAPLLAVLRQVLGPELTAVPQSHRNSLPPSSPNSTQHGRRATTSGTVTDATRRPKPSANPLAVSASSSSWFSCSMGLLSITNELRLGRILTRRLSQTGRNASVEAGRACTLHASLVIGEGQAPLGAPCL